MHANDKPARWKILLAFAIIYFIWGSTFLAIRVGVHEVPPFLLASMRFSVAGLVLCGWMLMRGERSPSLRQWASASAMAVLIFVLDYGLLFWAEQRVPSGIAAVVLTSSSLRLSGAPIDRVGAIALIIASVTWSIASALSRKLPLPESKVMSSGAQMLAGGLLLAVASASLGEFRGFHPAVVSTGAWLALLYLIVAGSIIGFTAYVWLLHHESPTKVGTYAYVNPLVAVVVGYFFAGEALGLRTVVGTLCVLTSVIVITTTPNTGHARKMEAVVVEDEAH
jgi:drug/metabolite transporter (DMT)-like permease